VVTYGVNQASKVASKVERAETMRNRGTIEMKRERRYEKYNFTIDLVHTYICIIRISL